MVIDGTRDSDGASPDLLRGDFLRLLLLALPDLLSSSFVTVAESDNDANTAIRLPAGAAARRRELGERDDRFNPSPLSASLRVLAVELTRADKGFSNRAGAAKKNGRTKHKEIAYRHILNHQIYRREQHLKCQQPLRPEKKNE